MNRKDRLLNAAPLTQTEETIFKMLAYELNNTPIPATPVDTHWDELMELAKRHAIVPLLYSAVKVMSDVPNEVIQTVRSAAIASALNNERKLAAQDEVLTLFMENGIRCAVLKGSSCAVHYPHPELRQMGDIDILIEPGELERVHELVQSIGYVYLEHSHEFHRGYVKSVSHSYIEIHYAVSYFPAYEKALFTKRYMESALDYTHKINVGGYTISVLDNEYQLISLLIHKEIHMFNGEIGLRQLMDWAILIKEYKQLDVSLIKSCGMMVFADSLSTICEDKLSIPVAIDSCERRALGRAILRKIIDGGNLKGTIDKTLSYSFVKPKFDGRKPDKAKSMVVRYILNINGKASCEFPRLNCIVLRPIFWVFYPARWWIRSLAGKREKISLSNVLQLALSEKEIYDALRLYR